MSLASHSIAGSVAFASEHRATTPREPHAAAGNVLREKRAASRVFRAGTAILLVALGIMLVPGSLAHSQPAMGEGAAPESSVAIADRPVRTEDLRALQRTLATTTPTTLAAARAELDDVLAGDGPPPFNNVIRGRTLGELPLLLTGVIAGASAIAAALGAGLVSIFTASRKVSSPLDMALENIEAACDRLATVAKLTTRAQDNIAVAAETAADAAKDSALTVARLAETTLEAQARLRDWLVTADASQDKAATLANQCTRLTEILPDLLGGAVETMQARGLAVIDNSVARLRDAAETIGSAADALRDGVAASTEGVTAQVAAAMEGQNMADGLSRQCQLLTESLPEILIGAIAPIISRDKSALDSFVDRLAQAASLIDESTFALQDGVAGMKVLATDHTAWNERHSAIALQSQRMCTDLSNMASAAVGALEAHSEAALDSIERGTTQGRVDMEAVAASLREEVAALAAEALQHSAHEQKIDALAQQCERLARDVPILASRAIEAIEARGSAALESVEGRLQDSALGVEAAAASLQESVTGLADINAGTVGGLTAALARAEGFVGLLPEITSNLAAAAANLRREAQHGAQMLEEGGTAVAQAAAASTAAAAELPRAAASLDNAAARIGAELEAAVIDVRDAASSLLAREEACNAALAARADAALGTLPLEASQIASVAASLREDAAALATAAWRMEAAAANQPVALATLLDGPTEGLAALCARIEEGVAGLGNTGAMLRAETGSAVAKLVSMVQIATEEVISASRGCVATAVAQSADPQAGATLSWHTEQLAALNARAEETVSRMALAVDALTELPAAAARLADAGVDAPRNDSTFLPEAISRLTAQTERFATLLTAGEQNELRLAMAIDTVAELPETVALRLAAQTPAADGSGRPEAFEQLSAQTERFAILLSAAETSAARLIVAAERVIAQPASQAGASVTAPAHGPTELRLMQLEAGIAAVNLEAARLAERAEAQDQAATRVAQAALEVAAEAAPAATARHLQQLPTLARLSGLAAETQALQAMAGTMAKTAIAGCAGGLPPDLIADAPALLAAIEVSIQQLRGTATALALASDAARLAA
jgi:hypothetical protein